MDTTQAATPVAETSLEAALESQFGFSQPAPKVPEPEEKPEVEAQQEAPADPAEEVSEELTADDLPEVEAKPQSTDDTYLEIVHDGSQVKLTREDAIKYARQGFDYTQKTQAVAQQRQELVQRLTQIAEMEQLQNMLAPEIAQVEALRSQLKPFQNVDWVRLAQENPLDYAKYHAQFQTLRDTLQVAQQQVEGKANHLRQQKTEITQKLVTEQHKLLLERNPEWRDPDKYQANAKMVKDYLLAKGVPQERIQNLNDAISVEIALEAAKYRQLQQAKAEKVKQIRTAPPVVKPGVVSQQTDGKAEFKKFKQSFKETGRKGNTRAHESLLIDRLNKAFKL